MRKIILFELNEVPFRVIDQFCAWRPNSCLARYLPRLRQIQTVSADKKLSPWTTWPTVHRGVTDSGHTIHEFGQDLEEIDRKYPPVWSILAAAGVPVGVCGSLHTYPPPREAKNFDFFIPDTFAAGVECIPKEVICFQDFNLSMARESARTVSKKIDLKGAVSVVLQSGTLGFKPSTFLDVGMQLLGETFQSWRHIRRRTYQAVLMFDVFMKQLRTKKPAFVTFFTNHVASSMHRYWAATFPNDYASFEFTQEWVGKYRNEIEWTMAKFDQFLDQLIKFADANPEYVVWIGTSMGQAATLAKELETELMLKDVPRFMRRLGMDDADWEIRPAMTPQINVVLKPHKIDTFRQALKQFSIDNAPLLVEERENGFFSMTFGQTNLHDKVSGAVFRGSNVPFADLGLSVERIDDKCGATAYHIPQGSLLVYDPQQQGKNFAREQRATTSIAPEILKNFGVRVPEYMQPENGALL